MASKRSSRASRGGRDRSSRRSERAISGATGRNGNTCGSGGAGLRVVPHPHRVMLTIQFDFDEPVSDRVIANAVIVSAPLFPPGKFRIVGVHRDDIPRN
jgi:hypothetical protein